MLKLINAIVQVKNQFLKIWSFTAVKLIVIVVIGVLLIGQKTFKTAEKLMALDFSTLFAEEVVEEPQQQSSSGDSQQQGGDDQQNANQAEAAVEEEKAWYEYVPANANLRSGKPDFSIPGSVDMILEAGIPGLLIAVVLSFGQKIYFSKKTVELPVLKIEQDELLEDK